ncbi:hypothetical protein O181_057753 [Austropuccinia psidii MF-1]|uniref:Endonuclease/exonuclease/phosphatase domain-containing protein n=1 Tax=Austropuccinia psidii MF-1 TaxID=1389203 RepID=A0A9Q3EFK2_9BASI|nr:hypothetical protein [Austropuccinia psidii MF-1]
MEISKGIYCIPLLTLYNPPTTFNGIKKLNYWLKTDTIWKTPTFMMMDSNIHHSNWNPIRYTHTHTQALDLIKICGRKSFHLISPRHPPTFLGSVGRPTTINLAWEKHKTWFLQPVTEVQLNNHSSDDRPLIIKLTPPKSKPHAPIKNLSMQLRQLNPTLFPKTLMPKPSQVRKTNGNQPHGTERKCCTRAIYNNDDSLQQPREVGHYQPPKLGGTKANWENLSTSQIKQEEKFSSTKWEKPRESITIINKSSRKRSVSSREIIGGVF